MSGEATLKLSVDQTTQNAMTPDDLALARRAASGDEGAFKSLIDRHTVSLFRLATSLTATRSDAEDLLQETFVGAYGGLKKFNGQSSVKTWMTSILMRQAAKAWHRNRHHRRARSIDRTFGSEESGQGSSLASDMPSDSASDDGEPTDQKRVDLKNDLQLILSRLDPSHREILLLREMQQMTYDEIAQSLGIPRGTVESRLFRARGELRRRLKDYQ